MTWTLAVHSGHGAHLLNNGHRISFPSTILPRRHNLPPRLKMSTAIPLHQNCACMTSKGETFTLYMTTLRIRLKLCYVTCGWRMHKAVPKNSNDMRGRSESWLTGLLTNRGWGRHFFCNLHDYFFLILNLYFRCCFLCRIIYSSSSIGTTAHYGLWPVEECPSIFFPTCHQLAE